MRVLLTLSAITLILCVVFLPAQGRPPIRKAFFNVYPSAVGTRLDDLPSNPGHCGVCHFDFDGGGPRNPFGLAVQVARASGMYATDEDAIMSVQNEDSDNDGYSNLIEITDVINFSNTPTFPGLAAGNVNSVLNVTISDFDTSLTPTGGTDMTPPVVTVTWPIGGETVDADSTETVTWTATDDSGIDRVDVFLSGDGGATFKPVAVKLTGTMFSWFVPNRPGSQSIIRVMARDGAGNWGSDESATFTINGRPAGIVPTTLRDIDLPGTQPFVVSPLDFPDIVCVTCHGNYNDLTEPWFQWKGSMMAQAMRDPIFLACLAVAEQDAPSVGDLCLRCHTPGGWLEGHSVDTGGGLVNAKDRQGIQCDFCHRLVDPDYKPGISPAADQAILDSLDALPVTTANGQFVVDPDPIRRGPYADAAASHAFYESPFHRVGNVCGTCHDVSNPVFVAGATPGDYVPNGFDAPHPDGDLRNMFPIERTYSEWSQSDYANGGVYAPQFAGNKPDGMVSSCEDCHMRDLSGKGCNEPGTPPRSDLAQHDLTGGNTCMLDMVAMMWPGETDPARLAAGKQRAIDMLQLAASMALSPGQAGSRPTLLVTVTNETAHKLPSGYPEGRRIWLNVKAYDSGMALVYESGAYDTGTGVLTHDDDLRIYETEPGLSPGLSAALGSVLPPGPSFHFVLNDTVYHDSRIPPRGFTNAGFEAVQSPPVAHDYPDGQYWDEALYILPIGATFVEVTLYYQTTTKEYVEFLRDENQTNSAGDDLYNAWVATGMCPPVAMVTDTTSLTIDPTGIEPPKATTRLLHSAPNPFTTGASIRYELESREHVRISIYDVQGKLVQTLVDEERPEGVQQIYWDGTNNHGQTVASGVYYYRMTTNRGFQATKKIVRVR